VHKVSIAFFAWISEVGNVVVFVHQRNGMCAQGTHCCYCLDVVYWKRCGLCESEELNVCTRYSLLLLLGSRILETWFVCIRGTECVHKVFIVVIAWISYIGNVVFCVHKRNGLCAQGIHCYYCLDLVYWKHCGLYSSEKLNVCTRYSFLLLLGSRILETL
jgi:hypothetical protein